MSVCGPHDVKKCSTVIEQGTVHYTMGVVIMHVAFT